MLIVSIKFFEWFKSNLIISVIFIELSIRLINEKLLINVVLIFI